MAPSADLARFGNALAPRVNDQRSICFSLIIFLAAHFWSKVRVSRQRSNSEKVSRSTPVTHLHMLLANALANVGNVDDSIEEYQKALALDPGSMEAHYSLGRILTKRGKTDAAISHYQQALAIDPADPDTHNNLGLLLAARGDDEKAVEHFKIALSVDPTYAKTHYNLGRLLVRQGRLDEAVAHFERALQFYRVLPRSMKVLATPWPCRQEGTSGRVICRGRETLEIATPNIMRLRQKQRNSGVILAARRLTAPVIPRASAFSQKEQLSSQWCLGRKNPLVQ